MAEKCKNCNERIVLVNGQSWTHQPEGSAFQDNQYVWCHLKIAQPKEQNEKV
jgi:hypothetical protein